MATPLKKYCLRFALFIAIYGFVSLFFFSRVFDVFSTAATCFALLFFPVLSISGHLLFVWLVSKNPTVFVRVFMLKTSFKLLLSLTVVVVLALLKGKEALYLIVFFLASYLIFLCYDTAEIYIYNKKIGNIR